MSTNALWLPNTSTNVNLGDMMSAGEGQSGQARIEVGKVYTGVITQTYHGDNLYTVDIDGIKTNLLCTWAAGIFSPLLGIRTKYYPALNTKVAVLATGGGFNWIISTAPNEKYDFAAAAANSMVAMELSDLELAPYKQKFKGVAQNVTKPNDLLEGEFDISNNFGVAVQFLTTMVRLKASERAKIEASLMDDMVRIVSETFKHYSAFGDYQIYNDGRLNVRFDGTSYEYESFGKLNNQEPLAQLDDKKVDFQKTFTETGRWRFSEYIGFLGDFIHTFVTEPNNALAAIAEAAVRPGKARMQMHSDGTILMQSVADIAIERVCRVISPTEKRRQDDPEGVKKDEFNQLNKEYLKIWNYGKDMSKAHYAAYQLRQYARWLSCFHSFARFHQLSKDWSMPLETDAPATHSWHNQEQDVIQANEGQETIYDVYATFRIMRDGSILVMDGYNSAISMVRGNIQMSAVRHIELDAAGDIRINAGQNLYIKARRNIEISAIVGGLTLKARAWWKALCEWGTVWIKSDAVDLSKEAAPTPDDPDQDPAPEIHAGAIFLDASKGQSVIQSERRITINTIGSPTSAADIKDTTASVVIQSRNQDVRLIGKRHAAIKSEGENNGKIIFDAEQAKAIVVKARKYLCKILEIFDINQTFTFKSNILNLNEIRSKNSRTELVLTGPKNPGKTEPSNCCFTPHGEHVQLFENNTPIELASGSDVQELTNYNTADVAEINPHSGAQDPPNGPDWSYTAENKNFDNSGYEREPTDDEVFQPMAQQRLSEPFADAFIDKTGYDSWDWEEDNKLKAGTRTNTSSRPFPGANSQEKKFDAGQSLHSPLNEPYANQSPDKAKDLVTENIVRKFLKYS